MPMPKPKTDESEDDFISRCMGDEMMKEDYPDQEQRTAVCYSQWREKDEDKNMAVNKYEIKALSKTEAEVWLYDAIGESWFGGMSAKQFAKDMKALGKQEKITVRINSPGGDVFDGVAIYNTLRQNRAQIVIHIDGLAASIASLIAMAGDTIYMAENALMMVHNTWGMTVGDAQDHRDMAERLDKTNGVLVSTYGKVTGLSDEEILQLMAAETWMSASEAKEKGFIHDLTPELKLAAYHDLGKFHFRNMPEIEVHEPVPSSPSPDPETVKLWSLLDSYKVKYGDNQR